MNRGVTALLLKIKPVSSHHHGGCESSTPLKLFREPLLSQEPLENVCLNNLTHSKPPVSYFFKLHLLICLYAAYSILDALPFFIWHQLETEAIGRMLSNGRGKASCMWECDCGSWAQIHFTVWHRCFAQNNLCSHDSRGGEKNPLCVAWLQQIFLRLW